MDDLRSRKAVMQAPLQVVSGAHVDPGAKTGPALAALIPC
jgi:hypothetical protein